LEQAPGLQERTPAPPAHLGRQTDGANNERLPMLLLGYQRDGTLDKRPPPVDLMRVKLAALSAARDQRSRVYRVTLVDPLAGDRVVWDSDVALGIVPTTNTDETR
jgi:hypothetical protein